MSDLTVSSRSSKLDTMSSFSTVSTTLVLVRLSSLAFYLIQCSDVISKLERLSGRTIPFFNADLTAKKEIQGVFEKFTTSTSRITAVIHFAALKCVGESVALPLKYYQNNVTGSINLLQVMTEFNVNKIIFSSSATVYGQPQYLPIDENHPTGNCTNPYGKSKFFMEEIFKVSIGSSCYRHKDDISGCLYSKLGLELYSAEVLQPCRGSSLGRDWRGS